MTKIHIFDLQLTQANLDMLPDLNSKEIMGGLSKIGNINAGVKFVPRETFTLPNGGVGIRLEPIFIPSQPQPIIPDISDR